MTRYFFDITGTLDHLRQQSRFTGIQRVVVTLAETAGHQLPEDQAFISFLDRRRQSYVVLPCSDLELGTLTDPDRLRSAFEIRGPRQTRSKPEKLDKYDGQPLRAAFHGLRHAVFSRLGRQKYRQSHMVFPDQVPGPRSRSVNRAQLSPIGEIAALGDHLIVMDAVWGQPDLVPTLKACKTQGLQVHSMLHDLIPVVAPQFTYNENLRTFEPWLRQSAEYTDSYLAVSRSTARDLSEFLTRHDIALPVHVTPLAQAALPRSPQTAAEPPGRSLHVDAAGLTMSDPGVTSQRTRALLSHPYVLCVGTLEIRKNVWKIAQVWERLRSVEGLALPKLVFAGKRGWMIEDFERMIAATGHLSGWIEIIEDASDEELAALYTHSLFTITASFYEGWGLPIGESLAYGKTAVVSNTSSMPEVGGNLVTYCDPYSIDSIFQACRRLIEDEAHRTALEARIADAALRQWGDVAIDLLAAIGKPDDDTTASRITPVETMTPSLGGASLVEDAKRA
jgi:glycosyltransferase involved in cell wall biosynthesis